MVQAALSCAELWRELWELCTLTPYVKRIKRLKNYFDTNSKFLLFSLYPRRSLCDFDCLNEEEK